MASNPMQRKSRNSFLLGVIVTLIIAGVIIALLLLQLKQKNDQINAEEASKRIVYTLAYDVSAGQVLTEDMFVMKSISLESIPSNATSTSQVISSWFLQTKEGEPVGRDEYGLYLDRSGSVVSSIIQVERNTGNAMQDSQGNEIASGDYYIDIEGQLKEVTPTSSVQTDDYGMYYIDSQGDGKLRVYKESATDEFYIYNINSGTNTRTKEYLDIKNVPVLAKVDMYANTVITPELVVQSSEVITDDTREEEYNMLVLPIDLMTDDYVDIRLMTPNGENFIVVSKARVEVPRNDDGTYVADTIKVNLREDEILAMSSAIVEAYGLTGSKLYVTKYADPAMQAAAVPTYVPNAAVTAQLGPITDNSGRLVGFANQNIVDTAIEELRQRYTSSNTSARNDYLQQYINSIDSNQYNSNVQSGMDEDIGTSITTRRRYLESLNSTTSN